MADPQTNMWGDPVATPASATTQAQPSTNLWGDPVSGTATATPPAAPPKQGYWSSLGDQLEALNPIPAFTQGAKRQWEEGKQIGQQLESGDYGQALNSTLRAIPFADTIRAQGHLTVDQLKKAYDEFQKGNYIGPGGAYEQAEGAVPFIGPGLQKASQQSAADNLKGAFGTGTGVLGQVAAPEFIPGAASRLAAVTPTAAELLDWAGDTTAPLQNKMVKAINALPPTLVKNAVAATTSGLSPHPLIGWFTGKAAGQMLVDWAKDHPDAPLKDAPPKVQAAAKQAATVFGAPGQPVPLGTNPQLALSRTLTTENLPEAYPGASKVSAGIQPLPPWKPTSYPVLGRSASMEGSAIPATQPDVPWKPTQYPVVGQSASMEGSAMPPTPPDVVPPPTPVRGRSASMEGYAVPATPPDVPPQPLPVWGRSATMQGSAMAPTPAAPPVRVRPAGSPSQGGGAVPTGWTYTGTSGTFEPGFTGTAASPGMAPAAAAVETRGGQTFADVLNDVSNSQGGAKSYDVLLNKNPDRASGVYKIAQDFWNSQKPDAPVPPQPTAPIVTPQPVSPASAVPSEVATPAAVPELPLWRQGPQTFGDPTTVPHQFTPQGVTIVHDTWPYGPGGTNQPRSFISQRSAEQLAQQEGVPVAEMKLRLKADNWDVLDNDALNQGLFARTRESMGGTPTKAQVLQKMHDELQKDWPIEKGARATSEELLGTYGKTLKIPGPLSQVHINNANYMLGNPPLEDIGAQDLTQQLQQSLRNLRTKPEQP